MRIGVDGRSLASSRRRGVGRVTFELLAAMAARFPQDDWRVLLPPGPGTAPPGSRVRQMRLPGRVLFGTAAVCRRPRLDALLGGVDVVWLPAPAPVALSAQVPVVLTLHDLSWLQRPGDFTPYERLWHRLARPSALARRAAQVATVSRHTRDLALERWQLDRARVSVVAAPVSLSPPMGCSLWPEERDPYFLWVGALEPRKGPDVLAAAWREAIRWGLRARLVVVGEGRSRLEGPGIEHVPYVGDAELAELYSGALAVVLPSLLEGAGLVPLEAALHGTPAVCSDLRPLRESLGPGGAEWVAPGDAHALAGALLRTAGDRVHRERIARAARAAARARADPGPAADQMRELLAAAAMRG